MTRYLLDTGSAGDYIHRRRSVYQRAPRCILQERQELACKVMLV